MSMATVAEWVLWFALAAIGYTYLGYPLLLAGLSALRPRSVAKTDIVPPLSVIITAYNEAAQIGRKIENTLALDYPPDRLQVIVASDCSTDATDQIVAGYAARGVELVRAPERRGKEHAQGLAVAQTRGEIIVFSDVATKVPPEALRRLAANFADPRIGCVSSVDRFVDPDGRLSGEGAYVRYEMLLRCLESRLFSVVGLSGSFFAARREVCEGWQPDIPSDFNVLLASARRGLRGVSDPEAVGLYTNVRDESKEFSRKVRTVLRGLHALRRHLDLLNPLRYGLFAFELLSHKLMRWLVPFFMAAALVANLWLWGRPGYRLLLAAQGAFYAVAVAGIAFRRLARHKPVRLAAYLLMTNASIMVAWAKLAAGKKVTAWQPSQR
jgi:glycosyltransferase involved in cell wall biosynthesis